MPAHLRLRVDRWLGQDVRPMRCPLRGRIGRNGVCGQCAIVDRNALAEWLVFLQKCVALLVIVLGETRLLKRLLPLADPVSQQRLDLAAERLNESLAGLNWQQILARTPEPEALERRAFGQCVAPCGGALAAKVAAANALS